jgi:hypothetical protein
LFPADNIATGEDLFHIGGEDDESSEHEESESVDKEEPVDIDAI